MRSMTRNYSQSSRRSRYGGTTYLVQGRLFVCRPIMRIFDTSFRPVLWTSARLAGPNCSRRMILLLDISRDVTIPPMHRREDRITDLPKTRKSLSGCYYTAAEITVRSSTPPVGLRCPQASWRGPGGRPRISGVLGLKRGSPGGG